LTGDVIRLQGIRLAVESLSYLFAKDATSLRLSSSSAGPIGFKVFRQAAAEIQPG
jgi:hypothetical protein